MSLPWLEKSADRLAGERFDIGRPSAGTYLTRWTLWGSRFEGTGEALFLHRFHRSDDDDALHDHPWGYRSVVLWGGYYEWTADRLGKVRRRWYGPGRVLTRKADHRHRVELPAGRDCWTLVFRGAKSKSWSFFCLSAAGLLTGRGALAELHRLHRHRRPRLRGRLAAAEGDPRGRTRLRGRRARPRTELRRRPLTRTIHPAP